MGSSSRVLLTVVLCLGIIVMWQYFFAPKAPPPGAKKPAATAGKGDDSAGKADEKFGKGGVVLPKEKGGDKASAKAEKIEPAKPGQGPMSVDKEGIHTQLETAEAVVKFTDRGAALRGWALKNPRYVNDQGGKLKPIDLVSTPKGKGPWPLVTTFPDSDASLPMDAKFSLSKKTKASIEYSWKSKKINVSKTFTLDKKLPVIWMTLSVQNLTERRLGQRLAVSVFDMQDPNQAKPGMTNPFPLISSVACHINGEVQRRSADSIRGEDTGCSNAGCGMGSGPMSQPGEVLWIGGGSRYFLTAVVPRDPAEQRRCDLKVLDQEHNIIEASLLHPEQGIEPGKSRSWKFAVYVGPKELEHLDAVTGPNKAEVQLDTAIEFGYFKVLCRPMLWLLKWFYGIFGNWGIAIILLTFVVKLLTLYWTQKSMRSMRAMSWVKPEMDRLREKFGDDKQRLNQEMMNLYKKHKINPLGGCLPMLIQMPVWFALYRTLGNSVDLYRSGFVGWIDNLTAPDPFYVLPIAMGIAMFGQQAITPQPMEGTQAKMMKYFMPVMFTFMMLWLPSGLTLYIFTNTVLTMAHQWYMNKTDPHKGVPLENKAETAGGGGPTNKAQAGQGRGKGKQRKAGKRRRRKK